MSLGSALQDLIPVTDRYTYFPQTTISGIITSVRFDMMTFAHSVYRAIVVVGHASFTVRAIRLIIASGLSWTIAHIRRIISDANQSIHAVVIFDAAMIAIAIRTPKLARAFPDLAIAIISASNAHRFISTYPSYATNQLTRTIR